MCIFKLVEVHSHLALPLEIPFHCTLSHSAIQNVSTTIVFRFLFLQHDGSFCILSPNISIHSAYLSYSTSSVPDKVIPFSVASFSLIHNICH